MYFGNDRAGFEEKGGKRNWTFLSFGENILKMFPFFRGLR